MLSADHAPATHVKYLACGGGVHNAALMEAIATGLNPIAVRSIGELGIDPDFVEAMTFAWLARERLAGSCTAKMYTP